MDIKNDEVKSGRSKTKKDKLVRTPTTKIDATPRIPRLLEFKMLSIISYYSRLEKSASLLNDNEAQKAQNLKDILLGDLSWKMSLFCRLYPGYYRKTGGIMPSSHDKNKKHWKKFNTFSATIHILANGYYIAEAKYAKSERTYLALTEKGNDFFLSLRNYKRERLWGFVYSLIGVLVGGGIAFFAGMLS